MIKILSTIFIGIWLFVFMLCVIKGVFWGGLVCVAGVLGNMWILRKFGRN